MICMTDSKCVIFLSIMYLFFFLQERDTLSKNILNSDIKIILKTKLIRNFASFFSAWFGEAYETRRPQYSKFISFKLQDLVTLASCCYPLLQTRSSGIHEVEDSESDTVDAKIKDKSTPHTSPVNPQTVVLVQPTIKLPDDEFLKQSHSTSR